MHTSDWIAVGSGALALISIVVSVLVALSQQKLGRREQLFAVTSELLAEFRSPDFKDRITYIENQLQADSPSSGDGSQRLSPVSWAQARPVMSYFNNVGLLVRHGSVSDELVSSMMGGSVLNTWKVLAPYVYAERKRRGDDPNYYGYFEHLAAIIADLGPVELESKLKLRKLPPIEAQRLR